MDWPGEYGVRFCMANRSCWRSSIYLSVCLSVFGLNRIGHQGRSTNSRMAIGIQVSSEGVSNTPALSDRAHKGSSLCMHGAFLKTHRILGVLAAYLSSDLTKHSSLLCMWVVRRGLPTEDPFRRYREAPVAPFSIPDYNPDHACVPSTLSSRLPFA
ncbi:hypothetical protein BO70DRAFT_167398 [Aspergillus heteromorphus CBS 117.55]|uniref:Uncharacterized protein n=1 Tax=Aspergillus heteromorphus CBS 117.55 TaxID=1448321 RepID=A0A317V3X5_9EURO|nr:uncharacterized protein BO70DRAFT_167398 [Aspergillus heteromorphus CBS 117.55]PWY67502.1 hypothetical protein BO70DRAFT_167398 [Aspergillus heteromorphus CBS 117.55]